MNDDRLGRYGAASGIVGVFLLVGSFLGFILPNAPDLDAPGTDWASYFTDHQSRIQVGVIVLGVGLFFFIWFLGSLRSALARAEGGEGRLASVAFGGGIVAVVTLFIAASASAVAAPTARGPRPEHHPGFQRPGRGRRWARCRWFHSLVRGDGTGRLPA